MNLTKLFDTQLELDAEIEEKHPTEKRSRIEDKFLALYTEIGECANEHRGFKFWSKNRKPRNSIHTTEGATSENAAYYRCGGCDSEFDKEDARLNTLFGKNDEDCPECEEGRLFAFRHKNPLLEEYVDGIHFLLSLGLEFGFEKVDFEIEAKQYAEIGTRFKERTITRQFNGIYYTAAQFESDHQESDFIELVLAYLTLGEMLGFTEDMIVDAYYAKNEINHKRQEFGY